MIAPSPVWGYYSGILLCQGPALCRRSLPITPARLSELFGVLVLRLKCAIVQHCCFAGLELQRLITREPLRRLGISLRQMELELSKVGKLGLVEVRTGFVGKIFLNLQSFALAISSIEALPISWSTLVLVMSSSVVDE